MRMLTNNRLMGDVSARIKNVMSAKEIIDELVFGAKEALESGNKFIRASAKL